jgi:mannose-6-phosphate isomerase-like protein (cupin superfamily)
MKTILTALTMLGPLAGSLAAADGPEASRHHDERDGAAKIIHRADVVPDRSTNTAARGGLWPLYSTPEARLNYFEVTGRTSLHFHPDAEHRLYVLEGKVLLTCGTNITTTTVGDFIVIPRGVRHCYDVPAKGDRALLLTFDAPPFDPRKTVNIESSK